MPDIEYLWLHYNGSDTKLININSSILHFSSLKLSDAGEYMCQVSISSTLLGSELTFLSVPPLTVHVLGKFIANLQLKEKFDSCSTMHSATPSC